MAEVSNPVVTAADAVKQSGTALEKKIIVSSGKNSSGTSAAPVAENKPLQNQIIQEPTDKLATEDLIKIAFVAGASLLGENVATKSQNMPWYTGKTLLETFDTLKEPEKPTNLPLRLPIQDVYKITGIGVVPVGRVETGIMKVNDKVIVVPAREGKGVTGEVKSIEMHHEQLQQAEPGDNVGFNVRGIGEKDIARGDVLGHASNVPTIATEFTAQIVVLNHPSVISVGYTPVFHIHTAQVACQIIKIEKKLDPATGQAKEENPDLFFVMFFLIHKYTGLITTAKAAAKMKIAKKG